jgi:hypothetical protein
MRAALLALVLLIAGPTLASAATDDELLKMIVGRWAETSDCAGAALTFGADGSFILVVEGEDPANQTGGSYKITDGVLSGDTAKGPMPEVALRIDGENLYFEQDGQVVNTLTRCTE